MFARLYKLELESPEGARPAPAAWLEQFFLRDFTGHAAFDETLPAGDGLLEAGLAVDPEQIHAQFEKWLRGRKMIPPETSLRIEVVR